MWRKPRIRRKVPALRLHGAPDEGRSLPSSSSADTEVFLKQILFKPTIKNSFMVFTFRKNQLRKIRTIHPNWLQIIVQHLNEDEEEEEGSARRESLPEEVLAAGLPLPGGEQRPAAGGPLQVHTDVLWFSFRDTEAVLLQSLVLHLQEVREEELRQRGARRVLQGHRGHH